MNRFTGLNLSAGKSLFRAEAMRDHPDHGGSEEAFKILNAEYDAFLAGTYNSAFSAMGEKTKDARAQDFADILAKVSRLNCRVEIIGFWIYCFDSYAIKEEIKALGFWFSSSHKAWVYSGGPKRRMRSHSTTDDNRNKWGSEVVREKEEAERVS